MIRHSRRTGLTLLEVIVSMAIFLISVIAITQLVYLGNDRAVDVRLQARTSMRCQSVMAEVMIGAKPTSTGWTNFEEDFDKDLQYQIESGNSGLEDLFLITVSVKADVNGNTIMMSQLTQYVLDPGVRGTTFD